MLKIQEIREIIKLIDQSSIEKFTYKVEGAEIKLEKRSGQNLTVAPVQEEVKIAPVVQAAPVVEVEKSTHPTPVQVQQVEEQEVKNDESIYEVTSPMVGTFYEASSPEEAPYVKVGDQVSEEKIVCIVEAMKLFNEIEAEVSGEIVEILVKDGQLVEYGQPLFLVKKN